METKKEIKTKMSDITKAYIDTNILIDYCWQNYFGEGMSEARSTRLMNRGFEGRFDIHFSTFSLIELSIHFRDWFLLQKVIKGGFSYAEFKRERSKYSLSLEEREKINYILSELKNNENINLIRSFISESVIFANSFLKLICIYFLKILSMGMALFESC